MIYKYFYRKAYEAEIICTDDVFLYNKEDGYIDLDSDDPIRSLNDQSDFIDTLIVNFISPSLAKLPHSITKLVFHRTFNEAIPTNILPPTIKSLVFNHSFNQLIPVNALPKKLESLTMSDDYNQPLLPDSLPSTLKTLILGSEFNHPIVANTLPSNLETLSFGFSFNQHIDIGILPNSLRSLTFGYLFNNTIKSLPNQLQTLVFGSSFNQVIEMGILPNSLNSIIFGISFNQILEQNVLPNNLKQLKILNSRYRYYVNHDNLEQLIIGDFNIINNEVFMVNTREYKKLHTFTNGLNTVYLIGSSLFKEMMICKVVRYSTFSQNQYDRMWNEREAMRQLKGKSNFVQLIDDYHDEENQTLYLISEYYGDDLFKRYIRNEESTEAILSERIIWNFISQLFSILSTLEKMRIVHCDIKPSNIFLNIDQLVLGDFGCCTFLEEPNNQSESEKSEDFFESHTDSIQDDDSIEDVNSVDDIESDIEDILNQTNDISLKEVTIGCEGYFAPEVATTLPYDTPLDIYSVGATMLQLLIKVEDGENTTFKSDYSNELVDFLKLLKVSKREDRKSLQMIIDNHFRDVNHSTHYYVFQDHLHPIPSNITDLKLKNYNHPISVTLLPPYLKILDLGDEFNSNIDMNSLPQTLEKLLFGNQFNQPILPNQLPPNLKYLSFGDSFNQEIQPNSLPSLDTLVFGDCFNQPIDKFILPPTLKTLKLGWEFNQVITDNTFPSSIESLVFGFDFNCPLEENMLPSSLKSLTFGYTFNQIIKENVLPSSLESLKFGVKFNQHIKPNSLPSGLKSLYLGHEFNIPIEPNILPNSIENLEFGFRFNHPIKPNTLPRSLESLTFCLEYNQYIEPFTLPNKLKSLTFGYKFNQIIDENTLPSSLETITFSHAYDFITQSCIPKTIKVIIIG